MSSVLDRESRFVSAGGRRTFLAIVLAVFLSADMASIGRAALELRVDLYNNAAGPGGNWNTLGGENSSASNLKDFNTGLGTGVDVTGANWTTHSYVEDWGNPVDWVAEGASADGWAGKAVDDPTVTFSDLDSGKRYKVEVVSCYGSSDFGTITITINGVYANANYRNTMSGQVSKNWDQLDAFNNQDWLIWSRISPNAEGKLIVLAKQDGASWGIVNAVRITELPVTGTVFRIR